MTVLHVHQVGPGVTVQDLGRPGWIARGLSRGGAADRLAVLEAATLLGTPAEHAVLEMMGYGGRFSTDQDTRIALTGAQMQADIDGVPVPHGASQLLRAGQTLTIGGARKGVYGYLGIAGGLQTARVMESRAAHLTAGIGGMLESGITLPIGSDPDPYCGPQTLTIEDRLSGGIIRIMPGPQTDYFDTNTLTVFENTVFTRSPRGNRQGVRLDYGGPGFTMTGQPNIVSDIIQPGDVQMTGDGVPYVLLAECQTIGGYPRIGTVIPADLPKVAQVMPGVNLQFQWLTVDQADSTAQSVSSMMQDRSGSCHPLLRDPHDIADLLSYQLISGATRGDDLERP